MSPEKSINVARGVSGSLAPGFTLIELVVVLVLVSLTLGVLIPRVGSGMRRMEEREFLQEVVDILKAARLRAMNSGKVTVFRISGSERVYDIEFPPRRPIPPNVDLFAHNLQRDPETGDYVMLFYPDGSFTGSDLEVLFDKERAFRIYIHPLLGTIRTGKAGQT